MQKANNPNIFTISVVKTYARFLNYGMMHVLHLPLDASWLDTGWKSENWKETSAGDCKTRTEQSRQFSHVGNQGSDVTVTL